MAFVRLRSHDETIRFSHVTADSSDPTTNRTVGDAAKTSANRTTMTANEFSDLVRQSELVVEENLKGLSVAVVFQLVRVWDHPDV